MKDKQTYCWKVLCKLTSCVSITTMSDNPMFVLPVLISAPTAKDSQPHLVLSKPKSLLFMSSFSKSEVFLHTLSLKLSALQLIPQTKKLPL